MTSETRITRTTRRGDRREMKLRIVLEQQGLSSVRVGFSKGSLSTKSGQSARHTKLESSFQEMSFLDEYITRRKKTSSLILTPVPQETTDSVNLNETSFSDCENDENSVPDKSTDLEEQPIRSYKRRRQTLFESRMDEALNMCSNLLKKDTNDECQLFGEFIAEGLRLMPEDKCRFAIYCRSVEEHRSVEAIRGQKSTSSCVHDYSKNESRHNHMKWQ